MAPNDTAALVFDAVGEGRLASKQGILQRLFSIWFDALVYNQIWEDPRVDIAALELDRNSRILTISSGGCNVLNYLIEQPGSVTAVDLNRHHIYLLNLKIAALRHLPNHHSFFAFFGYGRGDSNVANYHKYIAGYLDSESRGFWESAPGFSLRRRTGRIGYFARRGLYEHSRNGYFLRSFHFAARLLGCRLERVLEASGPEEQQRAYEQFIEPFFDSFVIRAIGRMPVTLFGLGIPPQQYEELKRDLDGDGDLIAVYRERAWKLAVGFPIKENYFAWQAFARKYDTEARVAVPEYLKLDHYATLREEIDNVSTKIGSVTDEVKSAGFGSYNRYVFLDAQDWMSPESIADLWSAIAFSAERGSRIIFRTAGRRSPVEEALPRELRRRFTYHTAESATLFEQDRASIYGGFHLYTLD